MHYRAILLALAAAALAACHAAPPAAPAPRAGIDPAEREQFSARSPYAVMDAPGMRYAPPDPDNAAATPWWHDRNDARLNLRYSTGTSDSTTYAVQQIDRQQTSGGRINDTYQRNLYSWRVGRLSQ